MTFDKFVDYMQKTLFVAGSREYASDPQYQQLYMYALQCAAKVFQEMGLYLKQIEIYPGAMQDSYEKVSDETKAEPQKAYEALLNYKKAD